MLFQIKNTRIKNKEKEKIYQIVGLIWRFHGWILTFRGTVSSFHRKEEEWRTNGGYRGGRRRRREYRRPGSQLSRANIGLAENYSDSWTALVESERIQNCKRQIFGFDEAEDIYIGHVLHRISPRHPPCIAGINPNTLPFATFPRQVTDALEVFDILSARHLYDPVKSSWNETETFFLSFFFYLSSRFTFISSCLFLFFFHLRLSIIILRVECLLILKVYFYYFFFCKLESEITIWFKRINFLLII